jgi:hypothetical protein
MIFLGQFWFLEILGKQVHVVGLYIDFKILDVLIIVSEFVIEKIGK